MINLSNPKGLVPGKFGLISFLKVAKFSLIVALSTEVRKTAQGAQGCCSQVPFPGQKQPVHADRKGLSLQLPVRKEPTLSPALLPVFGVNSCLAPVGFPEQ